ncbi:MAG: hypothetical protein RL705_536, partial [Bacteroidota bacterium]
ESLSEISDRYGVTVSELKKWNRLRSSKAPLGRNLKIFVADNNNTAIASNERKPTNTADTTVVVSNTNKIFKEEKVVSYKDVVKYYKVRQGDNLGEISNKYGVTVAEVKKWNKLKSNNIALGASLKIIKNERVVTTVRKEVKVDKAIVENKVETAVTSNDNNVDSNENSSGFYEVQKGDNLFSIAKKFNVSLEDLKKWNNLDDLNVQTGSKLALVNKDENAIAEAPKTETKIVEHKVRKGEYLGSIAKKYNVTLAEIKEWNGLESNSVKLGETLIVSKKEVAINEVKTSKKENIAANDRNEVKTYYVKKGDSLFSIAKKYPGVTISDIKKWNGIKNESLKPGMKLKINNG